MMIKLKIYLLRHLNKTFKIPNIKYNVGRADIHKTYDLPH